MKKMFLSFALISLLLFGCDQNSTNNPVSSNNLNKPGSTDQTVLQGKITLNQNLASPYMNGSNFQLRGTINYTEELLNNISRSTDLSYDAKVGISVDADLTDISLSSLDQNQNTARDQNTWYILANSEDLVYTAISGDRYTLVKSFPVLDRMDGLELQCTFIVTPEGVKLRDVVLTSPIVD